MVFIVGLLLGALTLIFILQNTIQVTISFFSWNAEGSLAVILLLAVFVGMVISWIFSIPEMFQLGSLKRHNRRLASELEENRKKLAETQGKLSQAKAPVVLERTIDRKV